MGLEMTIIAKSDKLANDLKLPHLQRKDKELLLAKVQWSVIHWYGEYELLNAFTEFFKEKEGEILKDCEQYWILTDYFEGIKKMFISLYIEKSRNSVLCKWGTSRDHYNTDDDHKSALNSIVYQLDSLIEFAKQHKEFTFYFVSSY